MATTAEMLDSVRTAITAVEGGAQEVRMSDGRVVRYPDLTVLYQREKDLLARLSQESRAGGRITIGIGAGA